MAGCLARSGAEFQSIVLDWVKVLLRRVIFRGTCACKSLGRGISGLQKRVEEGGLFI